MNIIDDLKITHSRYNWSPYERIYNITFLLKNEFDLEYNYYIFGLDHSLSIKISDIEFINNNRNKDDRRKFNLSLSYFNEILNTDVNDEEILRFLDDLFYLIHERSCIFHKNF